MSSCFNYQNTDVIQTGGEKVVRKVSIRNGKGYKSVTKYYKGKKVGSVKKPIRPTHIRRIRSRKFIPHLFSDCNCKEKNKTRKQR
jgi:hypothetical protein